MYETINQPDMRSFRIFRDQHDRKWGADTENKTQAPCGPISPRFSAPLIPPAKYIRLVDKAAGTLHIDYDQWERDLETAHDEYTLNMNAEATRLFGDRAHEMIERRDPVLLRVVGVAPEPLERVQAARAGNKWVLGFSDKRPSWADKFFGEPKKVAPKFFPDAEDEDVPGAGSGDAAGGSTLALPVHVAGKNWRFFDGETRTAGNREAALALHEDLVRQRQPAAVGAHPSWGDE